MRETMSHSQEGRGSAGKAGRGRLRSSPSTQGVRRAVWSCEHHGFFLMRVISFLLCNAQHITIGKLVNEETLVVDNRCCCL